MQDPELQRRFNRRPVTMYWLSAWFLSFGRPMRRKLPLEHFRITSG